MGKGTGAGGRVRWDLKPIPQPPKPGTIERVAAEHIAMRLRERLQSPPSKWSGLAAWLVDRVKVEGNAITWPDSAAVQRMGLTDVDKRWLEEAIRKALDTK